MGLLDVIEAFERTKQLGTGIGIIVPVINGPCMRCFERRCQTFVRKANLLIGPGIR